MFGQHYILRDYQQKAVDAALAFFKGPSKHNALEVLPTGSGKSLIIADIVSRLGEPVLIFQPSKEILEQNLGKLASYGYGAAVYSASKGRTEVSNITLATIGSVVGKGSLFDNFRYIIVDEAHRINASEGMYKTFLGVLAEKKAKILGLTATPYRLEQAPRGQLPELQFITQSRPRVFEEMIYHVQNRYLFDQGYLARMAYTSVAGFRRDFLEVNSTGADFTDESVETCLWASNLPGKLIEVATREMAARKNALIFTRFVREAEYLTDNVEGIDLVTGETPKKERERTVEALKSGDIWGVANVGVFTIGFDFPALETVIGARPTKSLALWYQMVGRACRPHPEKEYAKVIDLCGNYETFGRIEDLEIVDTGNNKWAVVNNGKQLTNVMVGEI